VQKRSPRGASAALLLGVAVALHGLTPALAMPTDGARSPSAGAFKERWVTATVETALYSSAESSTVLGLVPQWTSYRVDGPREALNGRFWVWSPYTKGRGWIPASAVGPGRRPTEAEIAAFWTQPQRDDVGSPDASARALPPHDYLYTRYPDLAPRLDCIASHESGWGNVANARGSGAFGPFQFLRSTFSTTPTGQQGGDWQNPLDQVDAAAEMLQAGRAGEWDVVQLGLC